MAMIDIFRAYIRKGGFTKQQLLDRADAFYRYGGISSEEELAEIKELINGAF